MKDKEEEESLTPPPQQPHSQLQREQCLQTSEDDKVAQKLLLNKMNPYLLVFCIPIIVFLIWFPPHLIQWADDDVIDTTPNVLTDHYYFFESKIPPIKIYAYNETEHDQHKNVVQMFGSNPPSRNKMSCQSEEIIIRYSVQQSNLRHFDADTADLFYCPFYLSISAMMQKGANSRKFESFYVDLLRKIGPYRDRYDGIDHVVVQMSPAYDIRAPIHSHIIGSFGMQATMSDIPPNNVQVRDLWHYTQYMHGSNANLYNASEDIESDVYHRNKNKRPISLYFMGSLNTIHWRPHGTKVRQSLVSKMVNITDSFSLVVDPSQVADFSINMHEKMRTSQMCLIPEWDSPTSRVLTDAMISYCVPLVYSDEAYFPFEGVFIDYTKVILQRPMSQPETLIPSVMLANFRRLKEMRKGLKQIGHLWEDSKEYKIEPNKAIWAWLWMQFIQNSVVVSSKRHFPSLLKSAYQSDIDFISN